MGAVEWWREPPIVAAMASILTLVMTKTLELWGARNALKHNEAVEIRQLLKEEADALRKENREQRDEIRRLDAQVDQLRADKVDLQRQVTELTAKVVECQRQLRSLSEQRGWKKEGVNGDRGGNRDMGAGGQHRGENDG